VYSSTERQQHIKKHSVFPHTFY